MKNLKNKTMSALNAWGPTLMIVIAVIPIGGLMLGIGTFMQNATFMQSITWLANSYVYGFSTLLKTVGNLIIGNLPILFCIAVAEGLSDHDGVAAFAAFLGYMVFNTTISSCLGITAESVAENSAYTTILGINTLQTGVLGGMIVGLVTSIVYKKTKDVVLPEAISFFQGKRFVSVTMVLVAVLLAIPFMLIWPTIQKGIDAMSYLFVDSNNQISLFVYAIMNRILIPFGLHNIWYPSFYFQFGNYTTLAGEVVHGDLNIFLAQMADGVPITTGVISGGAYLMPAFCIGAALAIVKMAKPENKKKTLGLFIPGIIIVILTGITEPIEFLFLFSCPALYAIHAVFVALGWNIFSLAGIRVGTTFCGGLMDLLVYGVLQNAPGWMRIIPLNIVVGLIYYFIFGALIKVFDFKTPGREDVVADSAIDFKETGVLSKKILEALGGKENIAKLDACATRLRVTLHDKSIDKNIFKESLGAKGVMEVGDSLQIIYGTQASTLKEEIKALMEGREISATEARMIAAVTTSDVEEIVACVSGKLVDITDIPDDTFAQKLMGIGFAIDPSDGEVVSPVCGTVTTVFPTKHAIGITSDQGKEVLLHLGLETVQLEGKPFTTYVQEGDIVSTGTKLANMNLEMIKENGLSSICITVFTNMENLDIELDKTGNVQAGEKDFFHFIK